MKFVISKDSIYHEWYSPFWRGLRCKLGFHRWNYWHMAPSFIAMLPKQANVCRTCLRCDWMEITDDGVKWQGRL